MANIFTKNFYLCFSKIKCLPTTLSPPLTNDEEEEDDDNNLLPNINPNVNSSTFLKNFNSLYDLASNLSNSNSKSLTSSTEDFFSSSEDSDDSDSIPDFSTVFASERFFFSSPGNSNSIVESPASAPVPEPEPEPEPSATALSGGVAIQTYSPDPYADFRRSMQEMVDAHEVKDVKADWDFLHELLLCYLNLNPKHTHKFIIGAFTDLIVSLMSSTTTNCSRRKSDGHQDCPTTKLMV
ncbi:hypothetical protein ACH5RR_031309 [Cinchona calisaya]|uniref:Transcription repressor n=1 Tax=Cinchona calisaya TaxID=153742 RepID=A0ABD2YHV5_9GENT